MLPTACGLFSFSWEFAVQGNICLPFGVIRVIFPAQSEKHRARTDFPGAASSSARNLLFAFRRLDESGMLD
jgi:hypothetical protein